MHESTITLINEKKQTACVENSEGLWSLKFDEFIDPPQLYQTVWLEIKEEESFFRACSFSYLAWPKNPDGDNKENWQKNGF